MFSLNAKERVIHMLIWPPLNIRYLYDKYDLIFSSFFCYLKRKDGTVEASVCSPSERSFPINPNSSSVKKKLTNAALLRPSSATNTHARLRAQILLLFQFVAESKLNLIEQSSSPRKQQSNEGWGGEEIDGGRGMEKRDSMDLSAIDW